MMILNMRRHSAMAMVLLLLHTVTATTALAASHPKGPIVDLALPTTFDLSLGSSRRLQQAACDLTVDGTAYSFTNCETLPSAPITLYYTLETSGSGTLFKGAIKATTSGYAAIGFSPSGGMIGSDAVIVKPDSTAPSGASVGGYKLKSYTASSINAAKGSFVITDTAAAKNADGTLVAVFSTQLAAAPNALAAAPQGMIFVNDGSMSGDSLSTHIGTGSSFGGVEVTLRTTTAPVAPVVPSPAPGLDINVVPISGDDTDDDDEEEREVEVENEKEEEADIDDDDNLSPSPAVETTNSPSPSATSPALNAAVDNSPAGSSPTTASACPSVTVANEVQTYRACQTVSIGNGFQVLWNLDEDPADAKSSILTMALSGPSTGYISVGFPSRAGSMTNAPAAILSACSTCTNGAVFESYYMTGTDQADVFVDNRMNMSNFKASAAGGVLSGSFMMKLAGTAASRRRSLLQTFAASSFPLIYAAGPVSGGIPRSHIRSNGVGSTVNLLSGVLGAAGGESGVIVEGSDSMQIAHMWIATIGWGIMIPLGIMTARYFKTPSGLWFQLHRAGMSLGFVLAFIGLILGFEANNGWETEKTVHRDLGLAATVLGFVQMFSLIGRLRPPKDHRMRPYWTFFHVWTGRSAAILAIANIYYGILEVEELGTWAWATYSLILGAIVLTAALLEVRMYINKKKTVGDEPAKNGKDSVEMSRQNSQPGGGGVSQDMFVQS